jgi:hypothetical protein
MPLAKGECEREREFNCYLGKPLFHSGWDLSYQMAERCKQSIYKKLTCLVCMKLYENPVSSDFENLSSKFDNPFYSSTSRLLKNVDLLILAGIPFHPCRVVGSESYERLRVNYVHSDSFVIINDN